ncbi:MAG: hypothetical protein ABSC01_01140 [Verrucomicrobiota bacterium]
MKKWFAWFAFENFSRVIKVPKGHRKLARHIVPGLSPQKNPS